MIFTPNGSFPQQSKFPKDTSMLLGARKLLYHERRFAGVCRLPGLIQSCPSFTPSCCPSSGWPHCPLHSAAIPFHFLLTSFSSVQPPCTHSLFHQPQPKGKLPGDESGLFTRNGRVILVPQKGDKCNATSRTHAGSLPEGFSSRLR